ncbi:hypothetical Protein YC6258_00770 [Gynuella sunshinyii YC6258]|uniref:Uncharacterized protein n=1 Tax=Gynuella sunshinyii YC6258 TaxID=1445510 RepID=A0A0C5UZU8_9GAMM|nr:hypothetical Protein YC6258_00770 [Gynuella sunshinyii YC6258]
MIKSLLRSICFKTGMFQSLYLKVCKPGNAEYTRYLKKFGRLHAIG